MILTNSWSKLDFWRWNFRDRSKFAQVWCIFFSLEEEIERKIFIFRYVQINQLIILFKCDQNKIIFNKNVDIMSSDFNKIKKDDISGTIYFWDKLCLIYNNNFWHSFPFPQMTFRLPPRQLNMQGFVNRNHVRKIDPMFHKHPQTHNTTRTRRGDDHSRAISASNIAHTI